MTVQALQQTVDLDQFFRDLARAPQRVLILDYDGTLAPFKVDPAEAKPYPGVCECIDTIMNDPRTHVVIVSGRWIRDLMPLLPLRQLPEIWGSHGWERLRFDGEYQMGQLDEAALKGLIDADQWVPQIERAGGRCERKPGSLAIHWRGLALEQIADIRFVVFEHWTKPGPHQTLVWRDFDGGIELRAPGRHKGYAVDEILRETGKACAAYLGDDLTDEDAFKAIEGRGMSVLVRPQYRSTAAQLWLRPPQDLLNFLSRWHSACKTA
jgi:trehalose 6-phosphate phosphatase